MRIYTRGGDKGKTSIHGGERVDKDNIRIEANGTLDELNSAIGVVRAYLEGTDERQELLFQIQKEMMVVMSHVATPSAIRDKNPNQLNEEMVTMIEGKIDHFATQMGEASGYFVLPGGNLISAHLHMARTIARRAERNMWTLHREDPLPASVLQLINRLSDLFFVMARVELIQNGALEERWHHFLYKRKK